MKWFFGIVAILVIGWIGAVTVINSGETGEGHELVSTDPLHAKQPLMDSAKRNSVKIGDAEWGKINKNPLPLPQGAIDTKGVQPQKVVDFAQTLIGTPYLYGSADPAKGFDCSGFITYVFNQFGIAVPRSSIDFTNAGNEVSAASARGGDLILFTGTDSSDHFVGHMGIVVSNTDTLRFVHSSSGKAHGVTVTPLNSYYQSRYVKTIRVFPEE